MTISYRPAQSGVSIISLGLAGPSKSGKTYSALAIGSGMVSDISKLFFIDTEGGRARQYVDVFGQFSHYEMNEPFSSDHYLEAIQAADAAAAEVIIVDSMSHEHEGAGGMLDFQQKEYHRLGNKDSIKFLSWVKPKEAHNQFVNGFLRIKTPMIFCFRAKEKMTLVKNTQGKQEPVPMGWQPICSGRFEYEIDAMIILPEGAKGTPDLAANATQMRSPMDQFITGAQLNRDVGEKIIVWAAGKQASKSDLPPSDPPLDPQTSPVYRATQGFTIHKSRGQKICADLEEYQDLMLVAITSIKSESTLSTFWDLNRDVVARIEAEFPDEMLKILDHYDMRRESLSETNHG